MNQPPQPIQYGQPIVHNAAMPVMINTQHPQTSKRENYHAKCVKGLSITQIILGILAFIFQIWAMVVNTNVSLVGAGFWTGILFIIAGSLGVVSSNTKSTCAIVSFLVMSIIACVFTVGLLSPSAIVLAYGVEDKERWNYNYGYTPSVSIAEANMTIAMGALLVIISVTEAIIAIISSCFGCQVLCCTDTQRGMVIVQGQVQYIPGPNGQTQMVIVPVNNPPYQYTTPVGGFMTQPLSVSAGGTLPVQVHGMPSTSTHICQVQPAGPVQPPTSNTPLQYQQENK